MPRPPRWEFLCIVLTPHRKWISTVFFSDPVQQNKESHPKGNLPNMSQRCLKKETHGHHDIFTKWEGGAQKWQKYGVWCLGGVHNITFYIVWRGGCVPNIAFYSAWRVGRAQNIACLLRWSCPAHCAGLARACAVVPALELALALALALAPRLCLL